MKDSSGEGRQKEKVKEGIAEFHELFSFADSTDFALMAAGTVSAVGAGLTLPIATFLFGKLVNSFGLFNGDDVKHEVTKVVLQFVYLGIGSGVASSLQVSCWIASGERQATRIRKLYMKSIIRQDISFYDNEATTGQVIASLSGDIILTQDAIGEKVGKFIHLISMFFGGFIIAIIKGWRLALILMACIPFIAITGAVMSMLTLRFSVRGQLRYAEAVSTIEETMGSIRTVVSFSGESRAMKTYDKLIRSTYKSIVLEGVVNGLGIGIILMFSFCSYGLAIWYGSELVINNGYTGGEVVNVMLAIMTGSMSLGQASPCVRAFSAGQVAAHKLFEVIRRKSVIDIYDMSGTVLEDLKGEIELRDIYFSYPTRPDQMIFQSFSLQVRSGMTMALIGESGSGKSTVVSLVERFYDPQAGEVLIDGFNLKNLRLSWIRKRISLVSQEPVLFMTTIKDNILYGKEDASTEEISKAVNLANVAKFINNMPYGLETMVGEHGTQLSGGQKQRIAIARAILRNPKILLLDEATSALDLESESLVHDALMNIITDRTTIIVAHRLTTVKNADIISVLHKGRLAEQGSHSELIENVGGAYSQMVHLQDLTKACEAEPSPSMNEMSPFKVIPKPATSHDHGHSKKRSMSGGSSSRRAFSPQFSFRSNSQVESCADDSQEIYVGNHAENEEKKGAFIMRLIRLNKPEIPALLAGTAAAVVNGVIFPVYGILLSSTIKTYYEPPHQLQKDAKFWALMHVLLGVVGFFVIPWQHYCFGVAGGRLVERIRSLLFQRTVHQEISWFDGPENSSGAIGARLSRDASLLRNLVGDTLSFMVQNSSTVICGLAIAFAANWKLAFVILASIPLIGLQAYVQVKFLRGFSADAKVLYEEATQVASEAVGGIRTVASFCAEEKVMIAYRRKCELPMRHGIQKGLISGLGYGFSSLTLYCTYAFCFYVGAQFIQDGTTTPAQLFRVFFALTMTAMGVSETSAHGLDVAKAKESSAAIFSVLDRKSKIDAGVESGIVLANIKGEIEFQHVGFSYPSRPEVKIFTDLCIRMPSGKTVALVGESGSGKSTVIYLIERFSDPDSGTILIDGVEIRELKLSWLRQQMGLVSQEPVLFRGSIRSNIAYGKHEGDASEDEIITAAKAANAHAFISSLSDGYNTNVGERGVQLSGGQKQRIAIARAVIRNPRILLLDEATSALDAESEHIVQEALERVMLGRTTICIAHRLSTIQSADTIAVVKDGVIAEVGKHQDLMSTPGGTYSALVSPHMM